MQSPRLAIAPLSIVCWFALPLLNAVAATLDLTSGLIAYYPFDGYANDDSGNRNHGVVHGATLAADKCGNPDSAYFLNRANANWIEVPHNDIQNTPVNAGLTLSLWINPQDASPAQALIGKQPSGSCAQSHSPTTSNHGGLFDTNLVAGQPSFTSQFSGGCGSEGHISQTPPLETQVWHHVVITVDVTNPLQELVRYYQDGQLAFSKVYNTFSAPILSQPSLEPIRIGKRKDSDFPSGPAYFWGAMDDIRIYNRPVTAAEVLALYDLYQENDCQPPLSPPTCDGREATIVGTAGDDFLVGTDGDDVIVGLDGDDVIYGLAGHDVICGGPGNDLLWGDSGRDRLFGEDGDDGLRGGGGNDYIVGGPGRDVLLGDAGNDRLLGGAGNDYLHGGAGDDVLKGGSGSDVCDGGSASTVDTADASCETVFDVP